MTLCDARSTPEETLGCRKCSRIIINRAQRRPMAGASLSSTAHVGKHPIHPMLAPFPIACFIGTFLSDWVYWRTANIFWSDLSAWLVTAGVILGFRAAIVGLIDFLGNRLIRMQAPAAEPARLTNAPRPGSTSAGASWVPTIDAVSFDQRW